MGRAGACCSPDHTIARKAAPLPGANAGVVFVSEVAPPLLSAHMSSVSSRGRRFLTGWPGTLLLIGVPLILIGIWVWRSWAPRTYKVNMLVDLDPNRALVAQRLAKEAKRHGLEVELSKKSY